MKDSVCDITIVLDRSGSMASIKKDTEGGFDSFVEEQKKVDGVCKVSLCQFDDSYDVVYEELPINEVPKLSLHPRGSTALLDAIARTINNTEKRINGKKCECCRPDRVIFVIITDGEENSSRENTYKQISNMIRFQEAENKWKFIFIGANQDAIATATKMGVKANSSLTFKANSRGTKSSYDSLSNKMSAIRSCSAPEYLNSVDNGVFFDQEDVKKQDEA